VIELEDREGKAFSKDDWECLDRVREKYKHNRKIQTDFHYVLIKEMVSQVHARTSGFVERKLVAAIIGQLLPDPQIEDERIECSREGRSNPAPSNSQIGLYFPRFCGEPDGGIAWPGQEVPFIVIETGYSDSGSKTRSRAQHWITQAGREVLATLYSC
jgi:hypothetical protein